ncbi:hypothetical protein FHR71_001542 [Methylobacterium sp. RAS18]|nr:hypothetical protein [Methylobacterium sp. RAS18]
MSRYKWYHAKWPISIKELGQQIKSASFQEGTKDGFVLDRVREEEIEARYVEKINVRESITDPFGSAIEFDRVEYRQWRFRASSLAPGLELMGSTRGSLGLAYRLADLANHRVAIKPINVNVISWLHEFLRSTEFSGIVDVMQVGQIGLGRSITARTIIKGREDVGAAVAAFLENKNYVIEKIQFALNGDRKRYLTLSNTGGANLRLADRPDAIVELRKALEVVAEHD